MKIQPFFYYTATIFITAVLFSSIQSSLNNTNMVSYGMATYNYSTIENNTRLFLESLQKNPGPPIHTLTPSDARNVLSGVQATPIEKLPAEIENKTIPGGPNGEISIQIVKPQGNGNEILPVVMYFHGGGWVLGGFDTHERLLRELANGANAAIVYVNYTRSPEAKYPTALEEGYTATKWIAENGETLNLDSTRIAIAGDSAGGNLAAAIALLAKERGGPPITFQLLFYPVTDASFDTPSYSKYQEGFFLTREGMKWFWDNYLTNDTNRKEPTVSPLQASVEQLKGLPPTLIIVGEND
ncbi:MAG: alpha/beta hydrolase, partial [Nitrososphaeraceae archaeon]|nr:alpha/beta hydrolase [Nitrososphaeraceae archaeon]